MTEYKSKKLEVVMESNVLVNTVLNDHILEKISYHNKLRLQNEATEDYEQCAIHRDEIARLSSMLEVI